MTGLIKADHYSEVDPSEWVWPDFSPAEIACRHCGKIHVEKGALDLLQELRDKIKKPMIVTSGYRCPAHNRAVKGAKNSQHKLGRAFDISMSNHNPHAFKVAAEEIGFTGIGTYPPKKNGANNFMHVDNRPGGEARWGDPFPISQDQFTPEARPQGVKNGTIGASAVVGGVAGAHEVAKATLPQVAPALPEIWIAYAAGIIGAIGVFLAFWKAIKAARTE